MSEEQIETVQQPWERTALKPTRVAVIGLGYVGLPLALAFAKRGEVAALGIDVDPSKAEAISDGRSYIKHVAAADIAEQVRAGMFEATTDMSRASTCDAVVICVPTPLTPEREPDLSYIQATASALAPHVRAGQLIVLESTTYPGTTVEVLKPLLERGSGLVAGRDFYLAFSPEREDPGSSTKTHAIPKVVGGYTPRCMEAAMTLYGRAFERIVPVSSCEVAEMTKLLENIFRSVNIALVNELKMLCDRMNLDVWEVIDAASTKPFGFMAFQPGPGLGGHCIPLDPFYLSWKAAEYGAWARFIELAGEVNTRMPRYVVGKVAEALNADGKPLHGSRVLVLGLAYKANIDDDRESPSYEIIELLKETGARVEYCDPFFPEARPGRKHN
ncbi:MAG TPA: nucleotide sugar dehydrogenase, partial [Anaeromyxobacteraceae bacterium]|nr:nucleotide sugar dehydrogenase [Anaeromyxobacteraceae bacterium]